MKWWWDCSLWQQEDVFYHSCHRIDWIFCRGLTSIWPCLCLGFIQPAAARLLFSFFFSFFSFFSSSHLLSHPIPSSCLGSSLSHPMCLGADCCLPLLGHLLRSQPTHTLPDLLVSNREMNMSHSAKPSCHVFSEAENEIQKKKPTPQKIQKKKERAMMSVFPPAGPPPNTPFQPQYFIVKLCIFSTGPSLWESWFDLIWFFWGGGSVLHPAVIYISDTHGVGKRQTIKQLRVSALTCCFPEVKTGSAWL